MRLAPIPLLIHRLHPPFLASGFWFLVSGLEYAYEKHHGTESGMQCGAMICCEWQMQTPHSHPGLKYFWVQVSLIITIELKGKGDRNSASPQISPKVPPCVPDLWSLVSRLGYAYRKQAKTAEDQGSVVQCSVVRELLALYVLIP